jgi:Zn-dependent protease with chaperone function
LTKAATAILAWATHPVFGGEGVSGRIVIDRFKFHFEADSGEALEIPLIRLQISRLASGEFQFTDSTNLEGAVFTTDESVLASPGLLEQAATRNQIYAMVREGEMKKRLRLVGWFLAGFVVLAVIGWIASGIMARVIANRVPQKVEDDFGEEVMKEVKKQFKLFQDPKLQAKLDVAFKPLQAGLPPNASPYKFYFIEEPLPNAFALPGGHILVTRGMMDLVERPEELAGVLAHELAHVNQKHIFRKILSQVGPYVIFQILARNENTMMGLFGAGSELLINQSFSQEIESEADAVGWDYLVKAKIDPRGLTDLFRKLKEEQDRRHMSDFGIASLSSHPSTDKRITVLERKWEKISKKASFAPLEKGEFW